MRGQNVVKYLFSFLNLILAGCGIYSMYIAVDIVSEIEEYSDVIGNKYGQIIDVIIVITSFLFLLSILEVTCFWNAHYCNLITTGLVNLFILISLIGAGIGVFQNIESQEDSIAKNLKQNILKSYSDVYINYTINNLQEDFECCGAMGPEDYEENVPESCCENCVDGAKEFFARGCAPVLSEVISEAMNHMSYICFALWSLLSFSTVITVVYIKILCN